MTDRPMIFSAPMVRALIEGRKSQTRRVLKGKSGVLAARSVLQSGLRWLGVEYDRTWPLRLPYAPGDRLWVREAWKPGAWREDAKVAVDYHASPELTNTPWITLPEDADWDDLWLRWTNEVRRARNVPDDFGVHHWLPGQSPLRWRPSIHMPRWASRLTLTVTDVRVERLQDISTQDCIAEGIAPELYSTMVSTRRTELAQRHAFHDAHVAEYRALWKTLHGPDAWDANPWIVALTFTVRKGNIDD